MHKVSFVLPPRYSLASLPQPTDARIRIRLVPGHVAAVYRFKGNSPDKATVRVSHLLSLRSLLLITSERY